MSEITAHLRELLKKNLLWHWTKNHQAAFEEIKEILETDRLLKFYDVTKPVELQADASNKGLGVGLLQDEFPVANASIER